METWKYISYRYISQNVYKNPNTSHYNCGMPAQPVCSNILSLLPFLTPYNQCSSMFAKAPLPPDSVESYHPLVGVGARGDPSGVSKVSPPTSVGLERAQFQGWDAHLSHLTALIRTVWRLFPTSAGLHLLRGDMDGSAETHFSLGHFFLGNFMSELSVNPWHFQQLVLLKVQKKTSPRKKYSRKSCAFSFDTF